MKILHVTQGYQPAKGGTELLIQRVSEELVHRHGDDVTVFTTNCYNGEAFFNPDLPRMQPGWEEINGVTVRRFDVRSEVSARVRRLQALPYRFGLPFNQYLRALASGPFIPGLTAAIRDHPADVVAASSFPLLHMFAAVGGASSSGRPCVLHGGLHPEDPWGFDRTMIYRAIRRNTYIANTQYEADYVVGRGALPERVFTVGVGVDLERFEAAKQGEARQRLKLDDEPLVGFIGQLAGHKGVDTLLRAMPMVWREMPRARLLVAGGRTMFAPELGRMLDALLPSQRRKVTLRSDFPEEEKPHLFAAADVIAYPSGYESFGIAFLEAWAAGKPVIGCRSGAIPTVVADGTDGLLVPYQDDGQLATAILRLLRDPEWAATLGRAGRQKVRARYTWPQVAARFRRVYAIALAAMPRAHDSDTSETATGS